MMMDQLIAGFSKQLEEALQIGATYQFKNKNKKVNNVLIAGLGGSGIGGTIIQNYAQYESRIPLSVSKNYFIPGFVNAESLVIICSYSGNTEETIACLNEAIKKKATIVCITSGGQIAEIAQKKKMDCILIPAGMPPRACLGYSLVQLLYTLAAFKIIKKSFEKDIQSAIILLDDNEKKIQSEAKKLAAKLTGKIPIIYVENDMEGVAVRWRQQINENGKMLAWHHSIPEMNHNELVGWRTKNKELIVLFLRNENDYERLQLRMDINKQLIKNYASVIDIFSIGNSYLERALYFIHLGDWLSWFLAQTNGNDATEVKVIDFLKRELAKK